MSYILENITWIGFVIPAVLASLGYVLKQRWERRKNARKVLYLLLEIRNNLRLSMVDVEAVITDYNEQMIESFRQAGHCADRDIVFNLKPMMIDYFNSLLESVKTDVNERLAPALEKALIDLAADYPIQAYKLNGSEKLEQLQNITQNYLSTLAQEVNSSIEDAESKRYASSFLSKIGKKVQRELYDELKQDIKRLSWKCGVSEFIRCWFLLRVNHNKMIMNQLSNHFDSIIEEFENLTQK